MGASAKWRCRGEVTSNLGSDVLRVVVQEELVDLNPPRVILDGVIGNVDGFRAGIVGNVGENQLDDSGGRIEIEKETVMFILLVAPVTPRLGENRGNDVVVARNRLVDHHARRGGQVPCCLEEGAEGAATCCVCPFPAATHASQATSLFGSYVDRDLGHRTIGPVDSPDRNHVDG